MNLAEKRSCRYNDEHFSMSVGNNECLSVITTVMTRHARFFRWEYKKLFSTTKHFLLNNNDGRFFRKPIFKRFIIKQFRYALFLCPKDKYLCEFDLYHKSGKSPTVFMIFA